MNVDWISQQLDFIRCGEGIFLTTLFLICLSLHTHEKDRPEKPSWLLLGLFGLTYGFREWLVLASYLGFESPLSSGLEVLLFALACFWLMEFGRRATPRLRGRRAVLALYGSLLLLILLGLPYGFSGIKTTVRYFLALPAGLIAAWAFFREFKRRPAG